MKSVSVSQLKAELSRYLRMVRRGSEVQILERGVPIARLVGMRGVGKSADKARVERLMRAGVLRGGTGDLGWLLSEPPIAGLNVELGRAVEEDREDRL